MIALSVALGADARAVALMQYARIVTTVLSASLVGRIAIALSGGAPPPALSAIVAAPPSPASYLVTALVAAAGVASGALTRIPAGVILGPMILGVVAAQLGIPPAWPPGVGEAAYVLLGLSVGLMFDRVVLRTIRSQVPAMVASIFGLIITCACLGAVLSFLTNSNLVTGYLATTPGGLDSVAAIGLTSGADVSLMLAVQMVRLFSVILLGPSMARWLLGATAQQPPDSPESVRLTP
jgi:hypothetical protein